MAIQDHHGHQYSSPFAEEDVDDVVDDREIEDGEDLTLLLSGDWIDSNNNWIQSLANSVGSTFQKNYRSVCLLSGRNRCILFQKLKWMCASRSFYQTA